MRSGFVFIGLLYSKRCNKDKENIVSKSVPYCDFKNKNREVIAKDLNKIAICDDSVDGFVNQFENEIDKMHPLKRKYKFLEHPNAGSL
jgi:hypothetical protein